VFTVAPSAGLVSVTTGGVVSGAAVETVKVLALLWPRLPAWSDCSARAV
jgi:hypothetical protein